MNLFSLTLKKVENVLLDLNGHVTLIDLGLASRLDEGLSKGPTSLLGASAAHESGSLIYMSPEILNQGTSGRHSDWWALGILAHELLTGVLRTFSYLLFVYCDIS